MERLASTLALLLLSIGSCLGTLLGGDGPAPAGAAGPETVPTISATVLARYPHDPKAFTQGLAIADGVLYEGTGQYGESTLRRVDLASGSVLQQVALPEQVFGEGIVVVEQRILQLTWKSRLGYVYDRGSFGLLETFGYATEGWGLTYDGSRLIMSDGSSTLRFLDPATLAEVGQLAVRAAGRAVPRLNELEYVEGAIYANVWQSDQVAIIDPASGQVEAWIDLSQLNPTQHATRDEVLNGIAYDAQQGRLFVTGKRWPTLYEIVLDQPAG
jgi:glutamine cyclotransferase